GAAFDRPKLDRVISALGNRVFLMNNVHEDAPVVFQTRWALSYLCGPLTREQIQKLMASRKAGGPSDGGDSQKNAAQAGSPVQSAVQTKSQRPVLPPGIEELFIPCRALLAEGATLVYRPAVLGVARIHFSQSSTGVEKWENLTLLASVREDTPA